MKIVKIRTLLVAGIAGSVGYVLGSKAGQERYEQIRVQAGKLIGQADRVAQSPKVRETVANVADKVKESADKLPDPVADVVTKVADAATGSTEGTGGPAAPGPRPIPGG